MKDNQREVNLPELKQLPERPTLRSDAIWEALFEQRLPDETTFRSIVRDITDGYRNMKLASLGACLDSLRNPQISAKNVETISFAKDTQPINMLTSGLIDAHPMAIRLTDSTEVKTLDYCLREANLLTTGELAGSVELWTKASFMDKGYKGSIAIGVVDSETNVPLGIVFCPENMLAHEYIDNVNTGRKRGEKQKVRVGVMKPVEAGVSI